MRVVVVASALLVLGACGVPIESEPVPIELEEAAVPDDNSPVIGELSTASMFLVRDELLVPVTRDLPSPTTPEIIFDSLLGPVTEPERRSNLRTAIPPGTQVVSVGIDRDLLLIDLSREFAAVGGEEEILAVAQIVLTATSMDQVGRVAFELDGVSTDVPVASGALSGQPVGADDYQSLIAP